MKDLTFLYAVSGEHKQFVLPFVHFASKYNRNSRFEIHFVNDFPSNELKNGLNVLRNRGVEIDFFIDESKTYNAACYRWILEPKQKTPFTYVGDIDIMICESVLDFHLKQIEKSGCLLDNIVRSNDRTRMSGLQFMLSEKYYDLTRSARLIRRKTFYNRNDEQLLLEILISSNLKIPSHNLRPTHGQHISLSRIPFKLNSKMKNSINPEYEKNFFETIREDAFKDILKYSAKFKNTLNMYLSFCGCKYLA